MRLGRRGQACLCRRMCGVRRRRGRNSGYGTYGSHDPSVAGGDVCIAEQ